MLRFVEDILNSTSRDTEQVTVEPSGEWHPVGLQQAGQRSPSVDEEDDEDLVEVSEPSRLSSTRQPSIALPNTYLRTPPVSASSREQSTSSAQRSSAGSKRPAAQTIDLTLSSDEEQPRPPPKRQMTSNPTMSPSLEPPTHRPIMPHRPSTMNSSGYLANPLQPQNSPEGHQSNFSYHGYPSYG